MAIHLYRERESNEEKKTTSYSLYVRTVGTKNESINEEKKRHKHKRQTECKRNVISMAKNSLGAFFTSVSVHHTYEDKRIT